MMKSIRPVLVLATTCGLLAQNSTPAKPKAAPAKAAPAAPAKTTPAKAAPAQPATSAAPAAPAAPPAGSPAAKAPQVVVPADTVVVKIGNTEYTMRQWMEMISSMPKQIQDVATGDQRRNFAQQFAEMKLLAEEGRKRGMDQKPEFKLQQENLLAQVTFRELAQANKPSDADLQKYYSEHRNEYEQARARHILITIKGAPMPVPQGKAELTAEQALAKVNDIQKRLAAGEKFEDLAKAESYDQGSGANGGDLGFFGKGMMVPEFDAAVWALPIGQVSDPIRTAFGYHLIKVEGKQAKSFDEVKAEIERKLAPDVAKRTLDDIKKANPIVLNDQVFGATVVDPTAPKPSTQQ